MVGGTFLVFIISFLVCAGTLGALFITGAELRILGRPGEERPRSQPTMAPKPGRTEAAAEDGVEAAGDEDAEDTDDDGRRRRRRGGRR